MEHLVQQDLASVFRCAVYLTSMQGLNHMKLFRSKRYECGIQNLTKIEERQHFAEYLQNVGPAHFKTMTMEELMDIVQMALDANVLSYDGNAVVPSASSTTSTKRLLSQRIYNKPQYLKRLERKIQDIKANIILLLNEMVTDSNDVSQELNINYPKGGLTLRLNGTNSSISLCKLPLIYKKRFDKDLDFTAGGYSKLADFLRNELPECSLLSYNPMPNVDQTSVHMVDKEVLMQSIGYQMSTNILFPLAMNASRLSDNAAIRLVTEW